MTDAPGSPDARSTPATPPPQPEGIRETLDSIVIAFILAFVFRAFIIEAFVIPTGSMAATLNGAHGTLICENCGWESSYGLTDPSIQRSNNGIMRRSVVLCRNCRYPNHPLETNDELRNPEGGDRILVLKWPFDIGGPLLGPDRWNVVVFKDPSDGVTNYIKRLAGLPGEVLQIVDGDVYAAPLDRLSPKARETLEAMRHIKYLRRTGAPHGECNRMEKDLAAANLAMLSELDAKLQIQRKSPQAQQDLWRTVYDHDYPPERIGDQQPSWQVSDPQGPWHVEKRTLRFEGADANEASVRLSALIDSFCAYNGIPELRSVRAYSARLVPISDMRVRFVLEYRGGDGTMRVLLRKRDDIFAGEIAADGTVRIRRARAQTPDTWATIAESRIPALTPGRKVDLGFWNLDYRVVLAVDGKEILATDNGNYAPDIASLRSAGSIPRTVPPEISANRLDVELSHVAVECDNYYLSVAASPAAPLGFHAWGTQGHPILLRDGEYFMLGDNSAQSKDSRLWDVVGPHLLGRGEAYQLGTVPEDQLIGRAFFVYWPSGLRTGVIPGLQNVGWIPNFGKMRWIR